MGFPDCRSDFLCSPACPACLHACLLALLPVCLLAPFPSPSCLPAYLACLSDLPTTLSPAPPPHRQVDFSDIIAGRPKEVGLQVLAAVCGGVRERAGLTFVDVSENAMGPDGVDACRPAIEGKKELRALLMCNDGLSEAAMEAVRVRVVVVLLMASVGSCSFGWEGRLGSCPCR